MINLTNNLLNELIDDLISDYESDIINHSLSQISALIRKKTGIIVEKRYLKYFLEAEWQFILYIDKEGIVKTCKGLEANLYD